MNTANHLVLLPLGIFSHLYPLIVTKILAGLHANYSLSQNSANSLTGPAVSGLLLNTCIGQGLVVILDPASCGFLRSTNSCLRLRIDILYAPR